MSTDIKTASAEVEYPTGDGQPMAETPVHGKNLSDLIAVIQRWLADRDDVYVSGNMMLYYVEGDPKRCVSPDVFVVFGVPSGERDIYRTWVEPKATLDLVIELTSRSTKGEDIGRKRELYRDVLGVREYALFDPKAEYLHPPQRLFRLENGEYREVAPRSGRLRSEVLELDLFRDDRWLRLWDPRTETVLATDAELAIRAQTQRDQAVAELAARDAEIAARDAEIAARDAEIAKLRAALGRRGADEG